LLFIAHWESPNPWLFFSIVGVLRLQISPKNTFSTLQIFPPAVEIASRPGCHNRPDSTRTRHPHAVRVIFLAPDFLGNFSTPPVEADPRGEYNFLEMASNGPVEQMIFLTKSRFSF